jgi:hypothetical protein
MKFRTESFIAHPRDEVFRAYRDRLPEAVDYLDDVREVNVLSREEEGSKVVLHNEWVSDREIPKVAQSILKPEHLRWDDYATWTEDDHGCTFEIKTRVFTDAVSVTGRDLFLEEDGGTRVILEGDMTIDLKAVPGVPKFLAGRIVPQVEKFIVSLIQPNLEKTAEAVGRFLDAQD